MRVPSSGQHAAVSRTTHEIERDSGQSDSAPTSEPDLEGQRPGVFRV